MYELDVENIGYDEAFDVDSCNTADDLTLSKEQTSNILFGTLALGVVATSLCYYTNVIKPFEEANQPYEDTLTYVKEAFSGKGVEDILTPDEAESIYAQTREAMGSLENFENILFSKEMLRKSVKFGVYEEVRDLATQDLNISPTELNLLRKLANLRV